MKVVIIEDEEAAALRLKKMLTQVDATIVVEAMLESISSAVQWLKSNSPDLIFADIHLADGPSFEIFKQVEIRVPIIFTTAYDQYALQAFKFNGIDYLLKPIKKSELEESLSKLKNIKGATVSTPVHYQEILKALSGAKPSYQKRIVIRFGQTIKTIEIADIAYFYTEEKVTFATTHDGKKWPIDSTLDELEGILDPALFFRVNRQFIIYIKAIGNMQSYSKSRIKLTLIPHSLIETIVSSERSAEFKEWLLGKS